MRDRIKLLRDEHAEYAEELRDILDTAVRHAVFMNDCERCQELKRRANAALAKNPAPGLSPDSSSKPMESSGFQAASAEAHSSAGAGAGPNEALTVSRLDAFDKGPWTPAKSGAYVQSEDFAHDARLNISGDFESADARYAYACALAATLNCPRVERCPVCKGSGVVYDTTRGPDVGGPETCPACLGEGDAAPEGDKQ